MNLMSGPKNAFLCHKDWPQLSCHDYILQIKNAKQPEQKLDMVASQNPLSEELVSSHSDLIVRICN